MRRFLIHMLKAALGERCSLFLARIANRWRVRRKLKSCCDYDLKRMLEFSGACNGDTREAAIADIIATYHVVEKGLTMPNRRFVFGREIVKSLMRKVEEFEARYGCADAQVEHAAGVVAEYFRMHRNLEHDKDRISLDADFKAKLEAFSSNHGSLQIRGQPHMTKERFYGDRTSAFDKFAFARHTLRHYGGGELPIGRIASAVEIALSTPSACNRQYCRVHCITDKSDMSSILEIQGGNRGFGHLADKLLIVTADLQGLLMAQERSDLYTNGGMFLMNLCYALYYKEIAHCILNWSKMPEEDLRLRRIVPLKPSETVIALLTCGETPDEFDVAASPRKTLDDVLIVH